MSHLHCLPIVVGGMGHKVGHSGKLGRVRVETIQQGNGKGWGTGMPCLLLSSPPVLVFFFFSSSCSAPCPKSYFLLTLSPLIRRMSCREEEKSQEKGVMRREERIEGNRNGKIIHAAGMKEIEIYI